MFQICSVHVKGSNINKCKRRQNGHYRTKSFFWSGSFVVINVVIKDPNFRKSFGIGIHNN